MKTLTSKRLSLPTRVVAVGSLSLVALIGPARADEEEVVAPAPAPAEAAPAWSVVIAPQGELATFTGPGRVTVSPLPAPAAPHVRPRVDVAVNAAQVRFDEQPSPLLPLRQPEAEEPAAPADGDAPAPEAVAPPALPFDPGCIGPHCKPNVYDYAAVYRAIPFSRAEYDANPSYRHEATMEFLFGKLRPTVIHKHLPEPPPTSSIGYITPYSYYTPNYRGWRRGYGVNYNFWYPLPTVYRNY